LEEGGFISCEKSLVLILVIRDFKELDVYGWFFDIYNMSVPKQFQRQLIIKSSLDNSTDNSYLFHFKA
jgi:hypothetical protein